MWVALALWNNLNEIMYREEKLGGYPRSEQLMKNLNDFMNSCGMCDIAFEGPKYTWAGTRAHGETVWCRLDRRIATQDWVQMFQNNRLIHTPLAFSGHLTLSLQVLGPVIHRKREKKSFKFEEAWLRSPDYKLVVHTTRNSEHIDRANQCQHTRAQNQCGYNSTPAVEQQGVWQNQ